MNDEWDPQPGLTLSEPWHFAERCASECDRPSDRPHAILIVETDPARHISLAEWLPRGLRRGDMITHFGGGRFAILLPGAGGFDAGRVASRIRHRAPEIDVGVAVFPKDGATLSELVVSALKDVPGPFDKRRTA